MKQKFYDLKMQLCTVNLNAKDREELMGRWLSTLETMTGDIRRKGVDQLMCTDIVCTASAILITIRPD